MIHFVISNGVYVPLMQGFLVKQCYQGTNPAGQEMIFKIKIKWKCNKYQITKLNINTI